MPVRAGSVRAHILTKPSRTVFAVIRLELIEPGVATCVYNEAVFCLQAKKPLPSGSYERRVPKIKLKIIFLYQGCLSLCVSFNIVIGHLRRP